MRMEMTMNTRWENTTAPEIEHDSLRKVVADYILERRKRNIPQLDLHFKAGESCLYAWATMEGLEDPPAKARLDLSDEIAEFYWDHMSEQQKEEFKDDYHFLFKEVFIRNVHEKADKDWLEKMRHEYDCKNDSNNKYEASYFLRSKLKIINWYMG